MVRTVLAPSIALAIACSSNKPEPQVGPGPAYSPAIANALRGIAPDCKLERTGDHEQRECRGRNGTVSISLTGQRFTALTIALPSKILPEAKGHFGPALVGLIGQAGLEQFMAKLEQMETGQNAELEFGNATMVLRAGGKSKIAPAYSVELTWK